MGAFAASALATVVRETDRRIVENDGLMTGTSIDGIIATGLATGASAHRPHSDFAALLTARAKTASTH